MNRKMAVVFGGAIAALATVAPAQITVSATNLGAPLNGAGTGYTGWLLTVNSNSSDKITGVDLGGSPGSTRGVTGTFIQRLIADADGAINTPTPVNSVKNPNPSSPASFDSHFLPPSSSRVDAFAPTEDFNSTNLTGEPNDTATTDWGTGTKLNGTFGIAAASQATSIELLYVVLPNASVGTFNISVASSDAQGVGRPDQTVTGTFGPVPEPGSLAILGLGGLMTLARRRRA